MHLAHRGSCVAFVHCGGVFIICILFPFRTLLCQLYMCTDIFAQMHLAMSEHYSSTCESNAKAFSKTQRIHQLRPQMPFADGDNINGSRIKWVLLIFTSLLQKISVIHLTLTLVEAAYLKHSLANGVAWKMTAKKINVTMLLKTNPIGYAMLFKESKKADNTHCTCTTLPQTLFAHLTSVHLFA